MVTLRKPVLLFSAVFLAVSLGAAAMPPTPNYCEHMGYNYTQVENGSQSESICRFDSNESCEAGAFLEGECGQEHVKDIPCRDEGEAVFTEFESCCGEMEPYLEPGAIGQATCQPEKSSVEKFTSTLDFLAMMVGEILLG
jgi:nitrite reductase/ring-hydroxylating ferredoxin subunit